MDTPFMDPAKPILAGDPVLSDENRADLWDVFHGAKDAGELAQKLQPLAVPDDTKRKLFVAKQQAVAAVEPMGKTKEAINQLAGIDPRVLDLAETHPNVLKALTTAAATTGETAGTSKEGGKGKEAKELPPLVQPPREDGNAHLPPIPDKHYRVKASDGGLHDIPAANIDKAREIDPTLHVLNP